MHSANSVNPNLRTQGSFFSFLLLFHSVGLAPEMSSGPFPSARGRYDSRGWNGSDYQSSYGNWSYDSWNPSSMSIEDQLSYVSQQIASLQAVSRYPKPNQPSKYA